MSLPSVIERFGTGTYSVSRDNVTVVDGLAVIGTPTTFTIAASVQPVDNKSLMDMPEGQNVNDTLVLWTMTEIELRTSTTAPDVVTVNGARYRCTKATYFGILSSHWRVFMEKLDVP